MSELISYIEKGQLRKDLPDLQIGDHLKVHLKVKEGNRERIQIFEGTLIARKSGGLRETITVRRLSYGVGVERVLPLHSPRISKIDIVRRGKVRRAKLYYLRDRVGKAAKVKERLISKDSKEAARMAARKAAAVAEAKAAEEAAHAAKLAAEAEAKAAEEAALAAKAAAAAEKAAAEAKAAAAAEAKATADKAAAEKAKAAAEAELAAKAAAEAEAKAAEEVKAAADGSPAAESAADGSANDPADAKLD
jgi:large subunit ribosomal protein L19